MQVEVSVQDCVSEDFSSISPETWEIWLRHWLEVLQPKDADDGLPLHPQEEYELSLRLTDDADIQTLNGQYRQKNQPTDVLAFAALEVDAPVCDELHQEPLYLGDVVISVETADRQARDRGHTLEVELAWLAAHGLLHLLGWDHPDEESLTRMLDQQQKLLDTVGLKAQV
jgi:probable rRNA maturation factor